MIDLILFTAAIVIACGITGFVFYVLGWNHGWEHGFKRGSAGERMNQEI